MKRFWRNNSLSIVMLGMFFVVFIFGQAYSGWLEDNDERTQHGRPPYSFSQYLTSSHFAEATMENWESEFLQMGVFILFTVFLYQKGSAESKDPDKREEVDRDPRNVRDKSNAPWPVRRGGWVLTVYENSLSLAFFVLFLISFLLHAVSGAFAIQRRTGLARRARRFRSAVTCRAADSGSSRSRTGRANSWRSVAWWCSAFTCGNEARPNRSRWMRLIPRLAPDPPDRLDRFGNKDAPAKPGDPARCPIPRSDAFAGRGSHCSRRELSHLVQARPRRGCHPGGHRQDDPKRSRWMLKATVISAASI